MGDNNLIRPQAYIGHDFIIGNHVYIAPGCRVASSCQIDDLSFIGVGSIIKEKTHIARETLIGAGSLVLQNTEPYSMYFGQPAMKVKEHKETGPLT